MRNILGHILLCLALMLCLGHRAVALPQGDNYDIALDKYAFICDRCVELRAKIEAGESVRTESLKGLLTELSSLRRTLSNASGKMSAAQAERFEAIKAKYLQGMSTLEKPVEAESVKKPERSWLMSLSRLAPVPLAVAVPSVTELAEVNSLAFSKSLRQAQRSDGVQAQRPEERPVRRPGRASRQVNARRQSLFAEKNAKPFGFSFLADAGMFPTPSFGAMAVVTRDGVGGYINYRSDFRTDGYSYDCSSDGGTEYGRIWATGNLRESRYVATTGFAMFTSRRFGFYAGGGLTSYMRCLEDVSGQWARVKDKSFKSIAADAGMFLTFKPLVLSAGVTSDFSGHADVQVGVGVRF